MPQLFRPRSNTVARMAILAAVLFLVVIAWLILSLNRSPYTHGVGVAVAQPVLFSHLLHVGQLELDCRYCHTSVVDSSYAGMPPTHACMTCHSQVAAQSPLLELVRESYANDTPLVWNRVYNLPDSVYFDHSIHLQKGVGCETCHGRVDQMPLVWQTVVLSMEWCLECHREPERFIRPVEEVFTLGWQPPPQRVELGRRLVRRYNIQVEQLTDCSICHR